MSIAISSRSANDRYREDADPWGTLRIPPHWRNQRAPTAGDTPATAAASSVVAPRPTASQNAPNTSRRETPGRPGERTDGLPVTDSDQPTSRPITHLPKKVLRRPIESAQYVALRYTERLADAGALASIGTVGDCLLTGQSDRWGLAA